MNPLVTGAAGFIRFHLARRASGLGPGGCGVRQPDYDLSLKEAR